MFLRARQSGQLSELLHSSLCKLFIFNIGASSVLTLVALLISSGSWKSDETEDRKILYNNMLIIFSTFVTYLLHCHNVDIEDSGGNAYAAMSVVWCPVINSHKFILKPLVLYWSHLHYTLWISGITFQFMQTLSLQLHLSLPHGVLVLRVENGTCSFLTAQAAVCQHTLFIPSAFFWQEDVYICGIRLAQATVTQEVTGTVVHSWP